MASSPDSPEAQRSPPTSETPLIQSLLKNNPFALNTKTLTAPPRLQELLERMSGKFDKMDEQQFLETFMRTHQEAELFSSANVSSSGPSERAGPTGAPPHETLLGWGDAFRASRIKEGMGEAELQTKFVRSVVDLCGCRCFSHASYRFVSSTRSASLAPSIGSCLPRSGRIYSTLPDRRKTAQCTGLMTRRRTGDRTGS